MTRAFFNWSTGKDSALALHALQRQGDREVVSLLTTVSSVHRRVIQHGVRVELLERQAAALGLPLDIAWMSDSPAMAEYEAAMSAAVARMKARGCVEAGFGDIFLADLRAYREAKLASAGVAAAFPLWKRDPRALIEQFIAEGFRAVVVCIDATRLDRSFAGRELDASFLADLPAGVDPCGENGEYHTFCYDGPIFREPVRFRRGEIVPRSYPLSTGGRDGGDPVREAGPKAHYWFCDLVPEELA